MGSLQKITANMTCLIKSIDERVQHVLRRENKRELARYRLPGTSAFGSKADMTFCNANVRFWPKADMGQCTAHVRSWG
jgi:hypothetical protein